MPDEGQGKSTTIWDVLRIAAGAANVLWCAVMFLWLGMVVFVNPVLNVGSMLFMALVLTYVPNAIAAVGVMTRRPWGGPMFLWVVLAQLALFVGWVSTGGELWPLALVVPGILTVFGLRYSKFEVSFGPETPGKLALKHGHLILVLVMGLAFHVMMGEAGSVAQELKQRQFQTKCEETGRPFDCRQAAMLELRNTEDFDRMVELEKQFAPLCAKGSAPACRSVSYVRSDYFARLGPPRSLLMDRVKTRGRKACLDGDGRGCAVAVWFDYDDREEVVAAARNLCKEKDPNACLVWSRLASERGSTASRPTKEDLELACQGGVTSLCDDPPLDDRTRCLRGELGRCEAAAPTSPELAPLAGAGRKYGNPGLYGVRVPPNQRGACDEGDSVACLFAGLQLVGDVPEPPAAIAPLPPVPDLDATLGRACDDGLAIACRAYGFRLLDRGVGEERDFDRANSWLSKGCELGSESSCAEISHERDLMAYDYEAYRKQKARACMTTGDVGDCQSYVSMLAFDVGGTPWPISDDIAYVHMRHACVVTGDPMACANAAVFLPDSITTPEYQLSALDLSGAACKQRYHEGCQMMFRATERWWPEHVEAMQDKICPQVPRACPDRAQK